jgi:predicted anti-sigma-YlaC factor YlaD
MMTCREILDFLDAFLDGALTAEQRVLFQEHLDVCDDCVNYLDSYRATVRLGKEAFATDLPPVPDDLVRAILAAR